MRFSFVPFLLVAALPLSFSLLSPNQTNQANRLTTTSLAKVSLFQAFPYEVRPGSELILQGSGFAYAGNTVNFGLASQVSAASSNGTTLNVKVPSSLSPGEYELSVSNSLGSSSNSNIKVSVKVTDNPRTPPAITSTSQSNGIVTMFGEGFSPSNSLVTSLGNLENVSSFDGRTINFKLSDLSEYSRIKRQLNGKSLQTAIWIHVVNERGMSKDAYKLDVTL